MYGLAIVLFVFLFGSAAAYLLPLRAKVIAGLLAFVPLLLVALLHWSESRGGCAGGECGPAQMFIGFVGLLALVPAILGVAFIAQAWCAGVALLLLGERSDAPRARLLVMLTPMLVAIVVAAALVRHDTAQPSAACTDRAFPATVAGGRVALPVALEVTVVRDGQPPMRLADLGQAQALCRHATRGPAIAAREITIDSSEREAARLRGMSLGRTWTVGGGGENRASICGGPFRASAGPLFCPPRLGSDTTAFSLPYQRRVTFKAATAPLDDVFPHAAQGGAMPAWASADDRTVHGGQMVGAFVVTMLPNGWEMREGEVAGDPLGLPRTLARCRAHRDGFARCAVRRRVSSGLAAYAELSVAGASDAAGVLPTIEQLSAFVAAVAPPSG